MKSKQLALATGFLTIIATLFCTMNYLVNLGFIIETFGTKEYNKCLELPERDCDEEMSFQDRFVGIVGMSLPILVLILGGFTTSRFAMLAKKNSAE
jgi:hypothetical protein